MHYLWRRSSVPSAPILGLVLLVLPIVRDNSPISHSVQLRIGGVPRMISQNDERDENEVSSEEVEKYVAVYKAMQRNRSLTVDQAAAAQGLSTEQFRNLENRVERDDAALQQARDELQAAARGSPTSTVPTPVHR
jgi:hypothetical protein